MKYFFVGFLHLLLTSVLISQPNEDVKRIVGQWVGTNVDKPSDSIHVEFVVKNDSLILFVEDEYGSMNPVQNYHVTPKKSGRKGLLYERVTLEVDVDGDTTEKTSFMKIVDLDKSTVTVVIGELWSIMTSRYGTSDKWSDQFRKKFKTVMDRNSNNSSFEMTIRRDPTVKDIPITRLPTQETKSVKSEVVEPTRTIHTGPRGGRYYYDDNGKKVYLPK